MNTLDKILIFLNRRTFDFFLIFIILNQLSFLSSQLKFLNHFFSIGFGLILFLNVQKKLLNLELIKKNLILLVIALLFLIEFFFYDFKFDLRISLFLILIFIISLCLQDEFDKEKFFLKITYFSLIFLIIGFYGWFNGGELKNENWGKSYVYFGYHYLPSTRNEDAQIFLFSFLSSLIYLSFYKFNWKILLLNQLNLLAIFLTFSRGMYVIILFDILYVLISLILLKKFQFKNFLSYFLISLFMLISSIQLLDKSVDIQLNKVFELKLKSIVPNDEHNIPKYNHLYKSSVNSLEFKINDWKKIQLNNIADNLVYEKNQKKYTESSILYLIKESNILILIFLSYFFISKIYLFLSNLKNKNNLSILVIFMINFVFLNSIYNYLDDIFNYLILLYLMMELNRDKEKI